MTEEDLEFEEDMGTPKERQRILSALRNWADSQPDQNKSVYITAVDMQLTIGEVIKHVEDETAIGVAILDVLVIKARALKEMTGAEIKRFLGRQFPLTNFRVIKEE